ncbi:MAG: hypothetical protein CMC14_14685 [Flavobacteriaceae bacterium]|nr:hypothetical protein [Flavobacteriaceae bacterium]|tara:strand:- start:828 stop:1337 length:510 start_codon:yes stop_codon:yes gene_type:complete
MKKSSLITFIVVFSIISCGIKPISERFLEIEKTDLMFGGMIKSANPFQIKGENGKRYIREKGGVGGINLKNPELDKLNGAEQTVTDSAKALLIIEFPLDRIIGYEIENENGFKKKDLVIELNKAYSAIYADKEKYGICCENFSDLELTNIVVFEVGERIYLESKVSSKK